MKEPDQLPHGQTMERGWAKVREIIDYLRSIRLYAGPGIKLTKRPNGIEISTVRTGGSATTGAAGAEYDRPFSIRMEEGGTLGCTGGVCCLNGRYFIAGPGTGITSATSGYFCLTSTLNEGVWSAPEYVITEELVPGQCPLGYCQQNGEEWLIEQYNVGVALIIVTGQCPVIANAQG